MAGIWDTLGLAHVRLGDLDQALTCYRNALAAGREQRDENVEIEALTRLGEIHHSLGDVDAARDSWGQVLALHRTRDQQREAAEATRYPEGVTPVPATSLIICR